MKTNKIFIAAAAIMALLASCAKESDDPAGDELTVRIAIKQGGAVSRAVGTPAADKVVFREGLLLFTDNAFNITKRIEVENNGKAYAADKVGRKALENEAVISGVPSVSTRVYFVGNPSAEVKNAASAGAICGDLVTTVTEQASATGGVENVTLFGGARLTPEDATGEKIDYAASFEVRPIVTRIEIGKITGSHSGGGTLTYDVTGIFINKYYNQMLVNGTLSPSLVDNETTVANYITDGTGSYTSANSGVVHDHSAAGLTFNPGQVWAYNLLAPTGGVIPSIVVRLENVVVNGTALSASQFITLGTFKLGDKQLTELKQGHIWAIDNIKFDENDISPAPYVASKSVTVKIDILNWERQQVTAEH